MSPRGRLRGRIVALPAFQASYATASNSQTATPHPPPHTPQKTRAPDRVTQKRGNTTVRRRRWPSR